MECTNKEQECPLFKWCPRHTNVCKTDFLEAGCNWYIWFKGLMENKMEKYKAKGIINFVFNGSDVVIEEREFNIYEKDLGWDEFDIYDLMPGEVFLEAVDAGFFIDYDGTLADVFVDGCASNLGLYHRGIRQGSFLATKDFWENLMKTSKVEVNWANK